jgi:hypothetical protein
VLRRGARRDDASAPSDAAAASDRDSDTALHSRSVSALKAIILLLLLAAAGVGAGIAYKLGARGRVALTCATLHVVSADARAAGHEAEMLSFRRQFEASAEQLHADVQDRLSVQARTPRGLARENRSSDFLRVLAPLSRS